MRTKAPDTTEQSRTVPTDADARKNRAWASLDTALDAASGDLDAEWIGRFDAVLVVGAWDALKNHTIQVIEDAARSMAEVRDRAGAALIIAISAERAVAPVTTDDLEALQGSFAQVCAVAQEAGAVVQMVLERAREARATRLVRFIRTDGSGRPVVSDRIHRVVAERGVSRLRKTGDGQEMLEIVREALLRAVFAAHAGAPRSASGWAYYAIARGLCTPPTSDKEWDSLRTKWRVALQRAGAPNGGENSAP